MVSYRESLSLAVVLREKVDAHSGCCQPATDLHGTMGNRLSTTDDTDTSRPAERLNLEPNPLWYSGEIIPSSLPPSHLSLYITHHRP